jgi:hypothetical protein
MTTSTDVNLLTAPARRSLVVGRETFVTARIGCTHRIMNDTLLRKICLDKKEDVTEDRRTYLNEDLHMLDVRFLEL